MIIYSEKLEYFDKKSIDLPSWIISEDLNVLTKEPESCILQNGRENLQMGEKNFSRKQLQFKFYKSIAFILYQMFLLLYTIMKTTSTMAYGFITKNVINEKKLLLKNTESRVENLNHVMQTLRTYTNCAEQEYNAITDDFKKIKNEMKNQEEILMKKEHEIDNLKEKIKQADMKSEEQNKKIKSLDSCLKVQEKEFVSTENMLKKIAEQFLPSKSLKSTQLEGSKNLDENDYTFIINEIQEMKIKIQQQENTLTKIQHLMNNLNELSHVNKNISRQSELIKCLKSGLRRKSDNLLESLKSIVGQDSKSSPLDDTTDFEEHQGLDESLSDIVQDTSVFLEEINTKYDLLDSQRKNTKEDSNKRISDIWKDSSITTIIHNSKQSNNSLTTSRKDSLTKYTNTIVTIEKGIQTDQTSDSSSVNVQATESHSDIKVQKLSEKFNLMQLKYKEIKQCLIICKQEKSRIDEQLNSKINELQIQISKLTNQNLEQTSEVAVLKEEIQSYQNYEKENDNLNISLSTRNEEIANLKKLIAEISRSEKNKDDKIINLKKQIAAISTSEKNKDEKLMNLQKVIKDMEKSHDDTVKKMKVETESVTNEFVKMSAKLITEKDNNRKLNDDFKFTKERLQHQLKCLEQEVSLKQAENIQLRTQIEVLNKTSKDNKTEFFDQQISLKQVENNELRKQIEALNKRFADAEAEFDKIIRRKNGTICLYKKAAKTKSVEIEALKTELMRNKPKEEKNVDIDSLKKVTYSRRVEALCSSNSQVIHNTAFVTSASSKITYRDRNEK